MSGQPGHLRNVIVGLDFDNTLVTYDTLFHRVAVEQGLLSPDVARTKKDVRDTIRALPDGEISWQKLQGMVYGSRMSEAVLADGVPEFFDICGRRGVQVYIVSHKTKFAGYDDTRANLRQSAMDWMYQNRFFDAECMALNPANVFFENTRQEKLGRIAKLNCTHFIDDLEEVFSEGGFPLGVSKILYAPSGLASKLPGVAVANSWEGVAGLILDNEQ